MNLFERALGYAVGGVVTVVCGVAMLIIAFFFLQIVGLPLTLLLSAVSGFDLIESESGWALLAHLTAGVATCYAFVQFDKMTSP